MKQVFPELDEPITAIVDDWPVATGWSAQQYGHTFRKATWGLCGQGAE